jgi:predicted outer membrane repeat protein
MNQKQIKIFKFEVLITLLFLILSIVGFAKISTSVSETITGYPEIQSNNPKPYIIQTTPESWGILNQLGQLSFTFNETVYQVSGKSIIIYNADDNTPVQTFTIPSDDVTGSGTTQITVILNSLPNGDYYILIDEGAFQNASGDAFAGITNPKAWRISILNSGNIGHNTTWDGNIALYTDITLYANLTIAPGTNVKFMNHYGINAKRDLFAEGTQYDSIHFFANDPEIGWKGIRANWRVRLKYCSIENGNAVTGDDFAGFGGAVYLQQEATLVHIEHCTFSNNHANDQGGAIYSYASDPVISNNLFKNNNCEYGGAISINLASSITLTNNLFINNSSSGHGGAILFDQQCSGTIFNNTFSENHAEYGGAISCIRGSAPVFVNCIFHDNKATYGNQINVDFGSYSPGNPGFKYCLIEGGKNSIYGQYNGQYENNLNANPFFIGVGYSPYKIAKGSPCTNSGDPATTTDQVGNSDLINASRIQNNRIDMGAYETTVSYEDSTGSAISFEGLNQYLNTPSNEAINMSDDFSIEAWIKPRSFNFMAGIVSKYHNPSADGYVLRLSPGSPYTGIDFNGQSTQTGILKANKWYHIAATYHDGEGCIYINGVKQVITDTGRPLKKNNDPLTVGVDYLSSPRFFDGIIDEVRIWNTVLDEATIRENMYLSLPDTTRNLAAYWQFNTGMGITALDQQEISDLQLNNMDESDWKSSDIPFGKGKSSSKNITTTGTVNFDATGVSINFFEKTGNNKIVVATIDTIPDVSPVHCDKPFTKQYFVIKSFDEGTFNSNITFIVKENLTQEDVDNPGYLSLYRRTENSGQNWERIAIASSVDLTNHAITFDSINRFGQFIIGRYTDTDPPELVSTFPESWGILQKINKLELVFNEVVESVNGKSVVIFNADNNTPVNTITIPSESITGSKTNTITIKLNATQFQDGNFYIIVQEGAFRDLSGNPFEGIASPDKWKMSIISEGQMDNPLTISGNIAVYTDVFVNDILTIDPGTNIKLKGQYKFTVSDYIIAEAHRKEPIRFYAEDTIAGWKGIRAFGGCRFNYCTFENVNSGSGGNQSGYGGVLYIWQNNDEVKINNCTFKNNHADKYGGAIYCYASSTQIKNSIFINNTSPMGGAITFDAARPTLVNNLFINNKTTGYGGAILFINTSKGAVYNNTFSKNQAEYGGAISAIQESYPYFMNSIFFDNHAPFGKEINVSHGSDSPGNPDFSYSLVEGGRKNIYGNYTGNYQYNIDTNPLFNETGKLPYKLSKSSPCIDKGNPSTTPEEVGNFDLANGQRFLNDNIDMGAYETLMVPDDFAGNVLDFNGSSQYAEAPPSSSLNLTDNFTIEAWIKPKSFSWNAGIVSKYQSPNAKGYYLRLTSDPDFTGISFCGSISPTGVLQSGKWYHIAGVHENGKNTIYINGVKQNSVGSGEDINENNDPLTIGVDYLDSPRYFDGLIDEVRIWNRVRSEKDIRENMYITFPKNTPNLISYWQFNSSKGIHLLDIMAHNSAELKNMADSCWKKSTIPFGPGVSVTKIISSNGVVSFPEVQSEMEIINHSGTDSITITLLDTLPNNTPINGETIPGNEYRIINHFGSNSLTANLTFKVDYQMTNFDELNPDNFLLFARDNNSDSVWNMIKHASFIDTRDSTVTFDSVSRFGQLLVTRNLFEKYPGYAVEFDTASGFIQLANEHHFDFQNTFTLETWLYTEKMTTEFQTILSKGNAWKLRMIYSDDAIMLEFSINEGPSQVSATLLTDTATMLHKWNHISCVYDNTSPNNFISIYLNGKQGNISASNPLLQNNDPVTIGSRFKGKLDEIRFWKSARTNREIKEHMNIAPSYPVIGLVSYLQLNEGDGTVAKDIYGGNSGSLINMNTTESWINSPVPFGGGTSNTQTETFGTVNFPGTGLSANYSNSSGASATVSKIDTLPNLRPKNNSDLFDRQYWVIHRYGEGEFNAALTFKVAESLTPDDVLYPEQIKLYYRKANSINKWTLLSTASNADLNNNTVTFKNISSYGQFIIARDKLFSAYPGHTLSFDGADDYVNGSGIDTSLSAFTMEVWIKHAALPDLVQRYITLEPEIAVLRHDGTIYGGKDELHFYIKKSNGHLAHIRVDSVLEADKWMHVAATYDGSIMKLYLNGELLQSNTVNSELFKPDGTYRFSSDGEPMDGKLDEIRIWKGARTATEIREDMHLIFNRSTKNLLNYWQFNSNTNQFTIDTVTGISGKLHNMNTSSCWGYSTIPCGMGNSSTQIVKSPGLANFPSESVSLNITSIDNTDSITITRINIAPNLLPESNYQVVDTGYWVVSNFEKGAINTNIAFSVSNPLTPSDSYFPSRLKLFSRSENSDKQWNIIASADSVSLTNNTVYFSNLNRLNQFLIARADNKTSSPGNCLKFDGIDDYVSIPTNSAFNNNQFSVEFWVSITSSAEWKGIIDKGRESLSNWYFLTGKSGQTKGVIFGIGTGHEPVVEVSYSWNDTNWHHVTGTYNGSTMKLYVDGELISSQQVAMAINNNDIHFGNERGNNSWFTGKLDEVRIWDRPLTIDEIRNSMHKPLTGYEENLTAYWQFDESSSDTLHDIAGNSNGLLHNMNNNNWLESTAPVPYFTITKGNWENVSSWATGQGSPEHPWSRIRINHNTKVNSNQTIIDIFLQKNVKLSILQEKTVIVNGD